MTTRILIFCEGQTEEAFVQKCLLPYFGMLAMELKCCVLRTSLHHKGGLVSYGQFHGQVKRIMKEDHHLWVTSLIDFYGIPHDFPGYQEAALLSGAAQKAETVESRLAEDLGNRLGESIRRRFIPHVQMHEFEGLLFSEPEKISQYLGDPHLLASLETIRKNYLTPEDINDSPVTAPGKQLKKLFPGYQKVLHGSTIADLIGLPTIRRECPLFDAWLTRLESLEPLEP